MPNILNGEEVTARMNHETKNEVKKGDGPSYKSIHTGEYGVGETAPYYFVITAPAVFGNSLKKEMKRPKIGKTFWGN